MYMKKQYKSSIIKNNKIKKMFFDGVPLKGSVIFRFCARNKHKQCGNIQ